MSQELLYTSAPRGLKPGSRGFCTVLSTQGMPAPLAAAVEGLSGYRPIYPTNDERAARNPVVYSHLKMQAAGRTWHVLSRIADYGLDYSQRSNKLAHHVILDNASERLPGGPANLLSMPGFMRDEWSGEPKVVALKPITREPRGPSGICRHWQELTGDAGWAGVLAESFLRDPERLVILLFAPGQEILPLFAEAISLLPQEKRWDVTFSTYFTGLATGTTCVWRAVVHDSKEARDSLRFVSALRIDLTNLLGPAIGGGLVEAARSADRGPPPHIQTHARTTDARPIPIPSPNVGAEADLAAYENVPDFSPKRIPQLPPHLAPATVGTPHTRSAPRQRRARTLADVIAEETHRPRRRGWLFITAISLPILVGVALCIRLKPTLTTIIPNSHNVEAQARTSDPPLPQLNKSANSSTPKPASTPDHVTSTSADRQPEPVTPSVDTPVQHPADPNSTSPEIEQQAIDVNNAHANETAAVFPTYFPNLVESKKDILVSFPWPQGHPLPQPGQIREYSQKKHQQDKRDSFIADFGAIAPTFSLLTPTWLKWTLDTPERQSDEDTIADINNQEDLTGPKLGSIGVLTRPNRLFDYQLKLSNNAANRSITWCALEIADTLPNDSNPHTILFHDPRAIAPTSVKLKANTPTWATQLPYDNTPPDTLIVDTIVIEYDSKPFNAVMGNWKTSQEKNSIECSSQLHVLADSISDEIGVTCTSSVTLTILAQLVNGQINISAKLSGLFGKDALFQSIASKLDQEVDSLTLDLIAHKELHDVKSKLNHVRSNLRGTTSTNAKIITNFKAAIVTFVGDALQKKKSDLIGENIKDQRIVLDKLEIRLLELPTKLDEIRVQKDTMISLKRQLDEIHIASMRVKHPISELVKKQRGAPKSLVILDFVDANQRIPQTAGKGTK